jgi:hypothetical protein
MQILGTDFRTRRRRTWLSEEQAYCLKGMVSVSSLVQFFVSKCSIALPCYLHVKPTAYGEESTIRGTVNSDGTNYVYTFNNSLNLKLHHQFGCCNSAY